MIYLIAGHHNNDSGAVANGLKEADLTKILRDNIYNYIKKLKPKVLITKDDDKDTLSQVIAKIRPKIQSSDILLDIHYNSFNSDSTGVECLVSNNAGSVSKSIAKDICSITSAITGLKNRGVKTEAQSARGKLGILNMKGSAVIWEVGFISNTSDIHAINKELDKLCFEIAKLLIKYDE